MKLHFSALMATTALSTAGAFQSVSRHVDPFKTALKSTMDDQYDTRAQTTTSSGFKDSLDNRGRIISSQNPVQEWQVSPMTRIEGQTRKTFQFYDTSREVVQLAIESDGRPVHSDINLWIGPDWEPMKMSVYSEDGALRPIQTLVGTRNMMSNIEVMNSADYQFPMIAGANYASTDLVQLRTDVLDTAQKVYVEGNGAVKSFDFPPSVDEIQVCLSTDTRQLDARVEILNGPNNFKQIFKIFTNNGLKNSLFLVFKAPGAGNVVRVRNMAPLEFPFKAWVAPVE